MSDARFNVERATSGFVLALFTAMALFLAFVLMRVYKDVDQRLPEEPSAPSASVLVDETQPTCSTYALLS